MDREMRPAPPSRTRRTSLLVAFFALGCSVAVAACASSSNPSTAPSRSYAQALKYTVCLRSHGVPNFPDPGPEGGIAPITAGSGINSQSPAFQSAQRACARLNPIAGISPTSYTASQMRTALEHAECMRRHGVSGYPDPTYGRYGSATRPIAKPLPSNINPQAPAFTNAEKACERT